MTNAATPIMPCPVCHQSLSVRLSRGRKSGKAFIHLICPSDGRHFRGFINDKEYVGGVIGRLEAQPATGTGTGRG